MRRQDYWKAANETIGWDEYSSRACAIPEPDRMEICRLRLAGRGRQRLYRQYRDKYSLYQIKLLLLAFRNLPEEEKARYGYGVRYL